MQILKRTQNKIFHLKRNFTDLNTFIKNLPEREKNVIQKYMRKHTNPNNYNHKLQNLPIPKDIPRPPFLLEKEPIYQNPNPNSIQYNKEESKGIRNAAQIVARALKNLEENIEVGMSADDADRLIHEFFVKEGAYPSGVGFIGFPRSVCISPNDGN